MNQLLSDTQGQSAEPFWLTGCLEPQRAYQLSPSKAAINLKVENVLGCHEVLIELQDHPGKWPSENLIAVSILVSRHGNSLLGSSGQLITLHSFQSFAHLPVSRIGSLESLMAVDQWLVACPYAPLKTFVYEVLGQPSVGCAFFSLPASGKHHHCYAGGLAQHSLEVAQSVYAMGGCFEEHERWLAAVAGLLHDLGKVRSFNPEGGRAEAGFLVSHEVLGFELLVPALSRLDRAWVDGANALRYLFAWMLRPRHDRPMMPIALTIRQADAMSAAADSRQRAFSGKPHWHSFAKYDGAGPVSTYWRPRPP